MPDLDRRNVVTALALGMASGGCRPAAQSVSRQFFTFATQINVRIDAPTGAAAHAAIDALQADFAIINRDWYAFGDGELGQLNRTLQGTTRATVSPALGKLLAQALVLRDASSGLFDPGIGQVSALWGFDRFDAGDAPTTMPTASALARAIAIRDAGFTVTPADPDWVIETGRPGLVIDVGGIAKGSALQRGASLLQRLGVERALLDAGGDIMTLGRNSGSRFRIGLRDPRATGVSAAVTVLPGEAVMSSGDYARYWVLDGNRYQHIIDPRDGSPVVAAQASTVIHRDPTLADAAATALIVAGSADFLPVCDAMGVDKALLIDNLGIMSTTPAMHERLL
ncbi:MAG: FAD:protein FMN transferase [Pseudomonadota bacterium]